MKRPEVLVVEDDRFFRRLIHDELTSAGYLVSQAVDAEVAREAIAQGTADVLLLDFLLPDGTGIDVWRYTERVNPRLASRTIIVTGVLNVEDRRELEALTSGPVLTKPFEGEDLLQLVHDVMEGFREGKEPGWDAGMVVGQRGERSASCAFCDDTRKCHHCDGTGARIRRRRWLRDKVRDCEACEGTGRCALCERRDAPKYG